MNWPGSTRPRAEALVRWRHPPGDRHARLVEQLELPLLQRDAQLRLERQTLARPVADLVGEELAGPLLALGVHQRRERIVDQRVRCRAVLGVEADADRGAERQLGIAHRQRARDRALQARGDRDGSIATRQVADHAQELVAVGPRDHAAEFLVARAALGDAVEATQLRAHAAADGLQHRVAQVASHRTGDPVEVVERQREHRDVALVGAGAAHRLLDHARRGLAVRQRGQGVVEGEETDPVLLGARVGHVLHRAADDRRPALRGRRDLALVAQHALRAAAPGEAVLDLERPTAGDGVLHGGGQRRGVLRMDQLAQRLPVGRLRVADLQQRADHRRDRDRAAIDVPLPVSEHREALGVGEPLLAEAQVVLHLLGAQQEPHALQQQHRVDLFVREVVRAGLIGLPDRLVVVQAGEEQQLHALPAGRGADARTQLEAIDVRHVDVGDDAVDVLAGMDPERLGAVTRRQHLVPRVLQDAADQQAHRVVVVDDEHAGRRPAGRRGDHGARCPSSSGRRQSQAADRAAHRTGPWLLSPWRAAVSIAAHRSPMRVAPML
jgi:hypothetical protein